MKRELVTAALVLALCVTVFFGTLNMKAQGENVDALVGIVSRQNDALRSHDAAIRKLRDDNGELRYAVSQLWKAVCAPPEAMPEHPELKHVYQ